MFGKSFLFSPPLDPFFIPSEIFLRDYLHFVHNSSFKTLLEISIYRNHSFVHKISIPICPLWESSHSFFTSERIFKTCLWIFGGDSFFISGCPALVPFLQQKYSSLGERNFDFDLIGNKVFRQPLQFFQDQKCSSQPPSLHKNLDLLGNRIGLDLGGSDIKIVSLQNGDLVHNEEISWNPYLQSDPLWHIQYILDSLQKASLFLPSVDSIGISIPGILVNGQIRVSALFQGVSHIDFSLNVSNIHSIIQDHWPNIPIHLCNDGDAAALYGGNQIKKSFNLLALSLGTSVAGGFIKDPLQIPGWFNELAFIPIDFSCRAAKDSWSTDVGCAASYLSQQAVFRLATQQTLIPPYQQNTKKLEWIQEQFLLKNPKATAIFQTMGIYLGYTVAYLARWYKMDSIVLLGRVCSKQSGEFLINTAKEIIALEFPSIDNSLLWQTPIQEDQKRFSQAIAAAFLSGPP